MTTTTTIKTHDWPVRVTFYDLIKGEWVKAEQEQIISPNSESTIYIWDTRSISFTELPKKA